MRRLQRLLEASSWATVTTLLCSTFLDTSDFKASHLSHPPLLLLQGVSIVPPGSALPGAQRILEPALKRAKKKSPAAVRFVTVGESGVVRVWDAER
jgi:hypothetical protein